MRFAFRPPGWHAALILRKKIMTFEALGLHASILKALTEAVDYVKTELMPNFDFDAYNHDQAPEHEAEPEENVVPDVAIATPVGTVPVVPVSTTGPSASEEVDKW